MLAHNKLQQFPYIHLNCCLKKLESNNPIKNFKHSNRCHPACIVCMQKPHCHRKICCTYYELSGNYSKRRCTNNVKLISLKCLSWVEICDEHVWWKIGLLNLYPVQVFVVSYLYSIGNPSLCVFCLILKTCMGQLSVPPTKTSHSDSRGSLIRNICQTSDTYKWLALPEKLLVLFLHHLAWPCPEIAIPGLAKHMPKFSWTDNFFPSKETRGCGNFCAQTESWKQWQKSLLGLLKSAAVWCVQAMVSTLLWRQNS